MTDVLSSPFFKKVLVFVNSGGAKEDFRKVVNRFIELKPERLPLSSNVSKLVSFIKSPPSTEGDEALLAAFEDILTDVVRELDLSMLDVSLNLNIARNKDLASIKASLPNGLPIADWHNLQVTTDRILQNQASSHVFAGHFRAGRYCGKEVAVKKKLEDFQGHSEENFLREALILYFLNQGHLYGIVEFYGVDDAQNPTQIVFERGISDAKQYFAEMDMSLKEKLRILSDCCGIFASLVDLNVLHRDIKPDNIFIMVDKTVKIANFGFVRSKEVGLSNGVTLRGTHSFIAPELLMSTSGKYEYCEATEMYSFAVTMNYILTGVWPFATLSETQLIGLMFRSKGRIRPESLSENSYPGNEGVSQTMGTLINLCWSVYAGVRLTFRQLQRDIGVLREYVVGESTEMDV